MRDAALAVHSIDCEDDYYLDVITADSWQCSDASVAAGCVEVVSHLMSNVPSLRVR